MPDSPVLSRLWAALREVEDPEIPVSLVDMGLIVSIDYDPDQQTARLRITYTAMGCPAMDMIQDDIRARLLREPGVARVLIEVVWDPVWTHCRLSQSPHAGIFGPAHANKPAMQFSPLRTGFLHA